ncbi:hypothetical protein D3C75_713690 [compost metagenome]
MLYDTDTVSQIAVYLFVGVIVGYAVDLRTRDVALKQNDLQLIQEKYDFLNEIYNDTRAVKEQLQAQIINSEDSFGKMFTIARELDSLEPEDVIHGAISVMEKVMKTDEISIYMLDQSSGFLRLMSKSSKLGFELPNSIDVKEQPAIANVIRSKSIYVNRNLDPLFPLFIAPVQSDGKVVAMVSIHKTPFEQFTLSYQNMFQVTIEMISASLTRSYQYVKASSCQRYVDGTLLLKAEPFEKILELKRKAKSKGRNEYTLLTVRNSKTQNRLVWNQMLNAIRNSDYAGMNLNGDVCIILSGTSAAESSQVIDRLSLLGLEAAIVFEDGEALYA